MKKNEIRYFSAFTGIGGFELGISRAFNVSEKRGGKKNKERVNDERKRLHPISSKSPDDKKGWDNELHNRSINKGQFNCVGYSEIDKYAIQIYQKHYPLHKNYGDITQIQPKDIPNFDLFVGGFPCQSFSIAGKRGGFNDTRGTLFFDIARICKQKQPRLLLLENVKGLLSHDKGETFATILKTLDEIGYDVQWQVLNSKDFGVPQNRERVFIVGHLRGTCRPKVFPIRGQSRKDVQQSSKEQEGRSWVSTLDCRYGERWSTETYVRTNKPDTQSKRNKSNSSNSIRRTSYTDGMRIRRLTPTECERLQGFPDDWCDGVSDTQKYKCLGNAVTTNVITEIIKKLL